MIGATLPNVEPSPSDVVGMTENLNDLTEYPGVNVLDSGSAEEALTSDELTPDQIRVLRTFVAECESHCGEDWAAIPEWDVREYFADLARDQFGDAVDQRAWDDDVWASDCLIDYAEVTVSADLDHDEITYYVR